MEREKDLSCLSKEEVANLQSQTMRNNLIFSNIPVASEGTSEDVEQKVRDLIHGNMKVVRDLVDKIAFERVHRMGSWVPGKCLSIVAKFHEYKEKEYLKKQGKTLQGINFFVNEQFPKEIVDKRRRLVPRMKAARQEGKRAWIAYDM